MLPLLTGRMHNCEGVNRRTFLQVGALGGLGLSLPSFLANRAQAKQGGVGKDVSCILIWTHGGTSHHDTFDPKPEAPVSVRGEFSAIDTAVPGVKFTEVCGRMAKELSRYGLLRSWNPANGSHGIAEQWVMTGRNFNPAVPYPCFGSVISHQHGFKSALPPFVQLGNALDRRFGGGTAGILGLQHNPFEILSDPNAQQFTVRDISLPSGVNSNRMDRRRGMLQAVDQLQKQIDLQPKAYEALDEHFKTALKMITAPETKRAFEVEKEDPKLRDRYGRHRLGQSLLLSRRLIESGVRFVTVTDPGWDTHAGNFQALKTSRMPPIDQGFPELLIDLQERGMLDSTLVVWVTDFGRTPQINSASGRDHWASAGFAIMAGAGIPGGSVVGRTDGEGGRPTHDEYDTSSIAATVYAKLGLPLDLMVQAPDGRPVRLIEGHPIREWL